MLDQQKTNKQSLVDDFEAFNVGKELPYRVPDDFFESVTEKTLVRAKQRVVKQKRRIWVLRTVFVISAAAALLAFIFLQPIHHRLSGTKMVAQNKDIPAEKMEDLLQDLSDAELAQLLASYKVDEISEVITQESVNIN